MKSSVTTRISRWLVNMVIALMVLVGVDSVLLTVPRLPRYLLRMGETYSLLTPHMLLFHRTLSTVVGVALIFISYRLFRRVRMAWVTAVCLVPLATVLRIFAHAGRVPVVVIVAVAVELVLVVFRRDFTRASDPITLKYGLLLALASLLLVFGYTAVGLFAMRRHFDGVFTFRDALVRSLRLLVMMDVDTSLFRTPPGRLFARSAILLNWMSLAAALIFILKPLIYQPIASNRDRERVRQLLARFGVNPISYVDVENDKRYYFGSVVEGVIAYCVAGQVAVCAGDPVCALGDTALLVSEFMGYCRRNGLDVCFCQVTEETLPYFKSLHFGVAKYGEEAMFDLTGYSIRGGKTAKVRQNVHHADRAGVTAEEYSPQTHRDPETERQIEAVSQDWLRVKKSGELSFLLGSVGLLSPLDRRYFVARDAQGVVCAFIVFVPFRGGFYTDVTRRRHDAPLGVMEKIIVTAFTKMRDEGLHWGSMGLAPLSNVRGDPKGSARVADLLHYVFEHMNGFYGFKALYQYKSKFAPSVWEPRYVTFYPPVFSPQIAYGIVKAQNRGGVHDYLFNRVRHVLHRPSGGHTGAAEAAGTH